MKFTAIDAVESGFKTHVISDATRAVNLDPGDGEKAIDEMREKGIKILSSLEFLT